MLLVLNRCKHVLRKPPFFTLARRCIAHNCTDFKDSEIRSPIKIEIEKHWSQHVNKIHFDRQKTSDKFYVLSMFPYPSGNLHMGHVRVYTISDAMARFYRMNGKNVFHPIGWDAFGLPAENAAIARKIEPSVWTKQNIAQMKEQLQTLGCSFDWDHELSTCDERYFKWTQQLFLMLLKNRMVYQKEALVNWDPVDKTVLADEQVDANGCSWRSGAKVEKKLLKQWFVNTTKFAKPLLEGLDDPILQDWRDIINLQKHWIGECNGFSFNLKLVSDDNSHGDTHCLRVWTQQPEYFMDPSAFIVIKSDNYLNKLPNKFQLQNPFNGKSMRIICDDSAPFPEFCDVYFAAPNLSQDDRDLANTLSIPVEICQPNLNVLQENRKYVLEKARSLNIGGYLISSKLQHWLISRQRYWGTPIPIVNCRNCGPVPVNDADLPVRLPERNLNMDKAEYVQCPKCGSAEAQRESDTMDTFVDSSWYFLRYLDPHNKTEIFNRDLIKKCMPVDLYIGGKEHAVLHLYYSRFINHFLHSQGLVPHPEPFKRLLVQGMVKGRSFRVKSSGKYLQESEVDITDVKRNTAVEKTTGESVILAWEKMSKSKMNGVDPTEMIAKYGCDTTRLIILADVAPMSHRNWSSATFPGVLNWQKRLWLTINDFYNARNALDVDIPLNENTENGDCKLYDARNYYIKGATFHYKHTHQLSVAISKMQGLTNSIRKAPKDVIKYGKQYERALATQLIMLAPMAPHFASELWSKFVSVPNRINANSNEILWEKDVLEQAWPNVDAEYSLDLIVKINGIEQTAIKVPRHKMDVVTYEEALEMALGTDEIKSSIRNKVIRSSHYAPYPGCDGILNIYTDKPADEKENPTTENAPKIKKRKAKN